MSDELEARLAPIVARERARMEAGATLADVLRRLRDDDGLGTLEQFHVLRTIKVIGFGIAKEIVFDYRDLELDLDDLALLASIPKHCKAAWWLPHHLAWAIIRREPQLLVDADRRDEVKRALDEPAWQREIAIERDDGEELRIRFVRVPPR